MHCTAETFLESSLANVRQIAVCRAPGDGAHNRGKRRASAPDGARAAKRPDHKRTTAGKPHAGQAPAMSDSCARKQIDDAAKWANDNVAEVVRRVDAYRRRVGGTMPEATLSDAEIEGASLEDHYEELREAEAACLVRLLGE